MITRSFWHWSAAAVFTTAGFYAGVAGAQAGGRAAGTAGQGAELRSERRANLSGPEQLQQAEQIITTLNGTRRRVSDMLDRARTQDRDIIKVNCLNDKLNQLDMSLRSARERKEMLEIAVRINNDGQRNHEYNLMVMLRQRAEGLEGEARQCIGEEAAGFGNQQVVTLRVANTIPTEETDRITTFTPTLEIPNTVSLDR